MVSFFFPAGRKFRQPAPTLILASLGIFCALAWRRKEQIAFLPTSTVPHFLLGSFLDFCWFCPEGPRKNFLYLSRLGLMGHFFPFSEDLDKTLSRPGPNSNNPSKGRPHSLAFEVRSPSQALTHIALLAELIRAPVFYRIHSRIRQEGHRPSYY